MADLRMATGHLLLPLCEKMVLIGARIEGVLTVNCSSVVNRPVFCSHDLPFSYHTTGAGLNLDQRH